MIYAIFSQTSPLHTHYLVKENRLEDMRGHSFTVMSPFNAYSILACNVSQEQSYFASNINE